MKALVLAGYLLVVYAARVTERVHLDKAAGTTSPTPNDALALATSEVDGVSNRTTFSGDFNQVMEEFKNGTRMLTVGKAVIKESAGMVTFEKTYLGFVRCFSPDFVAFDTYQTTLAPSVGGLTRLDFRSSGSPTFTCTDASIVNQIAAALSSDVSNPTLVASGQVPDATLSFQTLAFSCNGNDVSRTHTTGTSGNAVMYMYAYMNTVVYFGISGKRVLPVSQGNQGSPSMLQLP
eukprot:1392354-Amorphochlora_amoeboformis.AAC.1